MVKTSKYNISPEQFVRTWQECESPQEVAAKLAMPVPIVSARASAYRAMGLHLKRMKRKQRPLDIVKLNQIIDKVNEQRGLPPQEVEVRRETILANPDSKVRKMVQTILSSLPE